MTMSKIQFSVILVTLMASTSTLAFKSTSISNHEFAQCKKITADNKRLECYDNLTSHVLSNEDTKTSAAAKPKQEPANKPTNSKFGLEHKQYLDENSAEQITATVTKVKKTAYGHLKIYLDNGQIWKQTTTDRLKLKAKEVIIIERALLGSFTLKKADSNNRYKVKRLK